MYFEVLIDCPCTDCIDSFQLILYNAFYHYVTALFNNGMYSYHKNCKCLRRSVFKGADA